MWAAQYTRSESWRGNEDVYAQYIPKRQVNFLIFSHQESYPGPPTQWLQYEPLGHRRRHILDFSFYLPTLLFHVLRIIYIQTIIVQLFFSVVHSSRANLVPSNNGILINCDVSF